MWYNHSNHVTSSESSVSRDCYFFALHNTITWRTSEAKPCRTQTIRTFKDDSSPSIQLAVAFKPSRCRSVLLPNEPSTWKFSSRLFPLIPPLSQSNYRSQLIFFHHRATRPSAPSKSLLRLSARTVPSPSGSVCVLATPSGTRDNLRVSSRSRSQLRYASFDNFVAISFLRSWIMNGWGKEESANHRINHTAIYRYQTTSATKTNPKRTQWN